MGMFALRRRATNLRRSRIQNQARPQGRNARACSSAQARSTAARGGSERRGVVERPGVAAAIVSESEDGGEFQTTSGWGDRRGTGMFGKQWRTDQA